MKGEIDGTSKTDFNKSTPVAAKDEDLLAAMTHELKTPLTTILGNAQLIYRNAVINEDQNNVDRSMNIMEAAGRMRDLIEKFITIQKAQSGFVNIHRVDVRQTIEELRSRTQLLKLLNGRHPLIVDLSADITQIEADDLLLGTVLDNLLANASKYSPGGGVIILSVVAETNEIHFTVSDQGLGIPDKDKLHIFDQFYRVPEHVRQGIKGSGLGLSIVKQIIEAHKGRIWLESEPGKGSTFHFTIPKTQTQETKN